MSSTSSGSISGAIKWSGLATNTDFGSVVDQLVSIEERVITRQETWKSQWQAKLNSITTLDTRLVALKGAAEDYDERSELLARAANSSDESVATVVNTSTAATGVYSITVGENVQERIGSKTYDSTKGIGSSHAVNENGHPVGSDGKVLLNGAVYTGESDFFRFDAETGYPVTAADKPIANIDAYLESDPDNFYHPPLVISMGGKEMKLEYKPGATPGEVGFYSGDLTMEELVESINATIQSDPTNMPNISAEVIYDKTRNSVDYQRLVINGLEGGQKNHISVSDPTDLSLDKKSIDDPVTSSWIGSEPKVVVSGDYSGNTNKTITLVVTKASGNGILGSDDITFDWADTAGNSGTFTVSAADWDVGNNCLKEDVELLQGVKVNFQGAGQNRMIATNAVTIDCQTPVMQKAADIGLAQTDKWVHRGMADMTSPVQSGGTGLFAYSYCGKEYSVAVSDGLGLQGLVDKINSDEKNPGVIASVLNDGMGTATSYKLVLTGHKEGAEYAVEVLDSTKLTADFGADTFTHAREASNSMCRVDGYPDDGISWIQRPNNEVGDVLDGVVVSLQGVGETQITVQNNVTEMKNRITSIVEALNYAKTYIKEQTSYGGGKLVSKWNENTQMFERQTEGGEENGLMIGNYGFQITQSTIDELVTRQIFSRQDYIKAIDPDNEAESKLPVSVDNEERDGPSQEGLYKAYLEKNGLIYTRLSDIGIVSDPDNKGLYRIEDSKLTEALTKNPEAVIKLFTFTPPEEGFPTVTKYDDEKPRTPIGGFCVNMNYAMGDLTRATDVVDPETGQMKQPAKGIMKVLAENYNGIMSGIDVKISRETTRIAKYRQRLEDKFARLETLLASLNDQSTKIQSQIDSLSSNSGS